MPSETPLTQPVPPLSSLYLYLSSGCNLACRHCWIAPEYLLNPDKGEYLKYEYIASAIEQAKPLGLRSVKLTGGEPLLHPRFRDIVSLLRENQLSIVIETNGLLIDEDLAAFLAEGENKPFVSVSIDGAKAETHDHLRGVPGAFRRSMRAIEELVKVGFHPQIICTLHQGNRHEIDELTEMAEKIGCGSVKFNFIQQMGRGVDFQTKNGFSIPEILEIDRYLTDVIAPKRTISLLPDIPHAFHSIKRMLSGKMGRCTVLNILGIIANGTLSLCGIGTSVPELVYGHMKNNDLAEVWKNSPGIVKLRQMVPQHLEGICSECLHRDACLGACVANNYFRTGKLNNSYYFCEQAKSLGLFPLSRTKEIDQKEI
jgi:SynChlorMet cassette radical SAM/SPASM protein ScmF